MTSTEVEHPSTGWIADDSTFGARLALIRQRMGWGNVKEAAEACDVPVQSWRSWERDNVRPRDIVDRAWQIAEITGCDYEWLLHGRRERERRDPLAPRTLTRGRRGAAKSPTQKYGQAPADAPPVADQTNCTPERRNCTPERAKVTSPGTARPPDRTTSRPAEHRTTGHRTGRLTRPGT